MNWNVFWAMLFGFGAMGLFTTAYTEHESFYAMLGIIDTFISATFVSKLITKEH